MGKYNFDQIIDRKNTSCLKYDFGMQRKGRTDLSTNGSTTGYSVIRIRMPNITQRWTGGSPSITATTSSRNG